VELIGIYGSDETHALSAWTSTSRDLTDEKRGRMDKLLNSLAADGHHTPFEKSSLHFLVTTDIASHIHFLKHRIAASINAESARYKELKDDKFYIPVDWDHDEQTLLIKHCLESFQKYHTTLTRLISKGISRKRAKESARFYLPYCNQITADVMFNFRSFMHFQGLRNSEHAQLEIREIAQEMLRLVKTTKQFDMSLKAFGY
jgi:thymidylate synthase (FAD)